jgi:60 kDa SS-A/Ro ribonucleoprotein
VSRIVDISDQGRAPKNDPALFALALAAKLGDVETRRAAFAALPRVARIGTHLFHFAEYVKALGGWGRGTMRAFARWYTDMEAGRLAHQAVKYQSRDGWSHRDLLRKAHPVGSRRRACERWRSGSLMSRPILSSRSLPLEKCQRTPGGTPYR